MGSPLVNPEADGIMRCPESDFRYREESPGVLRCLDLDEEASLPPEIAVGHRKYNEFKQSQRTS